MICLVGIGNIPFENRAEATEVMKSVHVPPEGGNLRTGEPFNCRTWLKLAIGVLQRAGIIGLPLHVGESFTGKWSGGSLPLLPLQSHFLYIERS